MVEKISLCSIGILLGIQSVFDLNDKKIPSIVTILGAVIGVVCLGYGERTTFEIVLALLPGMLCILYAKLSQEALGYGDACFICVMGLFYSFEELFGILLTAFGVAGIAALVLCVVFHKSRGYEMAFFPFLFLGYGCDILLRIESGRL